MLALMLPCELMKPTWSENEDQLKLE